MGTWNFAYDTLNRLKTSTNTAVTSDSTLFASFNGCWSYDPFGNRLSEAMSTTACNSNPSLASWATYNTTNSNRMDTTSQNANQANGYDGAGDVLNDGVNQYLYDAEGRICAAWFTASGTTVITGYLYNADGLRVGKGSLSSVPTSCPTPTTAGFTLTSQYLLGLGGEQVTELNGSGAPLHANLFGGWPRCRGSKVSSPTMRGWPRCLAFGHLG